MRREGYTPVETRMECSCEILHLHENNIRTTVGVGFIFGGLECIGTNVWKTVTCRTAENEKLCCLPRPFQLLCQHADAFLWPYKFFSKFYVSLSDFANIANNCCQVLEKLVSLPAKIFPDEKIKFCVWLSWMKRNHYVVGVNQPQILYIWKNLVDWTQLHKTKGQQLKDCRQAN